MKKLYWMLLCLPVALAACSGSNAAPVAVKGSFGSIQGVVTDVSGSPVPGVTVRIKDRAAVTGVDGKYSFARVADGETQLIAGKPGYDVFKTKITIQNDEAIAKSCVIAKSTGIAEYDVIIVGAGTSGTSAAIQAAQMGMKVALVEETDWIGGQMTAASVTSLDEHNFFKSHRTGLYGEFYRRVQMYYSNLGKSTGTAYFLPTSTAFEPSAGQKILHEMINELTGDRVDLFLSTKVKSALSSGTTVTGITLSDDIALHGKVVIDATEYGDIIPLTGARYRSGNSTSDNLNLDSNLNPLTFCAIIKKYPSSLADGFLMQGEPAGYPGATYYSPWLTLDGTDAATWYFAGQINYPISFAFENAWRGMPDSTNANNYDASYQKYKEITKTSINDFHNDYAVTARYLEDPQYRKQVNSKARLKTLWILYYMQHDLGQTQWSVADDEGFDTIVNQQLNYDSTVNPALQPMLRHFPVMPYVRESRRAIGMYTLTASDIKRDGTRAYKNFPSSLAVGDYPIDLHGGNSQADLDCGDSVADIPKTGWELAGGAFQVPFETFIPEVVDGFLVAEKNLSVSRLASGSIRLQPITMMTGQAAGALAAVAIKQQVQPRQIRPMDVQRALLASGCILSTYNFDDVPQTHPYWSQIQLATIYNVMSGTGGNSFGADMPLQADELAVVLKQAFGAQSNVVPSSAVVTRAAFATAIGSMIKLDAANASSVPVYDDVSSSYPAFSIIQSLSSTAVVQGCSKTSFCPDTPISRSEAAGFIVNAIIADGINPPAYVPLHTDSQPPVGSITINNGAETTKSATVTLTISAQDVGGGTVTGMQFSKNNIDWYAWEPFATSRTAVLINGLGINTIYARFRDDSGNVSRTVQHSITLVANPPPVGSITINNGAATTTSANVTLTLAAQDPAGGTVTGMQFSKNNVDWYAWEPFATSRTVVLINGPGINTIYARFKNDSGIVSLTVQASITLIGN